MKFFKLENSSNTKETGTQFQSEEMVELGDVQREDLPCMGRIDGVFDLPEPLLQKEAKRTSLLSGDSRSKSFFNCKKRFYRFFG